MGSNMHLEGEQSQAGRRALGDGENAAVKAPSIFSGGRATTKALLHFVQEHAPPLMGADDPADQKRWEAFVIAAHQDIYPLSGLDLTLWLIHVHNWPEDSARNLGLLYDKERSTLQHYDHIREG